MKCQFCNQRCHLLKEDEADYSRYEMTWCCPQHPVRVLHHVRTEKYALRRDHSITGVSRYWTHTSIRWVNEKGQILIARFERSTNLHFEVYSVKKSKGDGRDDYNLIFELKEYPKDFTPENIMEKIRTLTIFS